MMKMKDSGVEWIGDIPTNWEIKRGKNIFLQRNTRGNDNPVLLAASQKYGMYPQQLLDGVVQVKEDTDFQTFKTVHKNDYVISLRSFQGGFEMSDYEGVCSPAYQVLYNRIPIDYRYYKMLFKSDGFISKMNSLTIGIREGKNIQYSDFARSMLPYPPLETQHRIADYLDKKCGKVDAIIEKQQAVIEKLKEYKLSTITEKIVQNATTKLKLKNMCLLITDGTHFSPELVEEGYPYITAKDVRGRGIDYSTTLKVDKVIYETLKNQGCQPEKGDVLLVKDGATTGRVGLMIDDTECVALSSVAMLRPKHEFMSEYLMYVMMSKFVQEQISISMAGSAMPRTTLTKLVNYWGLTTSMDKQNEIVEYLNKICSEIDKMILIKEKIISRLMEYKTALIYEAVTGKKEV